MSDAFQSARGFTQFPPIPSLYGGEIRAYESSLATQPAVWLHSWQPQDMNNNRISSPIEVHIHLPVADALKLADQLRHLVENHYQTRTDDADG